MSRDDISPHEVRNVVFNTEMALIDLRNFSVGGGVDLEQARERVKEIRAEATKLESLFGVSHG